MVAREYFDWYMVENSSWHEIVEVLQYTYIFGSRCIGKVLREKVAHGKECISQT